MSAPRESNCRLTDHQLLRVRDHIERYAGLRDSEKEDFHDEVARDVWMMVNDDYNWTELGEPPDDGTTSYWWTHNRVQNLLEREGSKDLRRALNTKSMKHWTGEQVFAAECKQEIKAAIYKDYPAANDGGHGFFKYYRTYMAACYKLLSEDDQAWFEARAKEWNTWGASYEVKAENAKNGLAKWLKEMTYKGDHDYGVYMAFVVMPEPGQPGEPRIVDYLRELKYAKEPLSKWVQWDTVTGRLGEYVTKAYNSMKADAMLEAPDEVVPITEIKGNKKPGFNVPSGIELGADYQTGRVLLPSDIYDERPDAIMWREQALFKEIMWKAVAVASNSKEAKPNVPWKDIDQHPDEYFPPECLPARPVKWDSPNNMFTADRKELLDIWFKLGYVKLNKVKSGKAAAVPAATLAGSGDSGAPGPPVAGGLPGASIEPIIGSTVVNRYGSRGREFLAAAGLELYEAEDDRVNANVMEDRLIDPAELDRAEDEEHNHLAPCVLVEDGQDKTTAVNCVKKLVMLPTSNRDDTTEKKIAKKLPHLKAPESVSWDAESLLLPEDTVMAVRECAAWELIRDGAPGASGPVFELSNRDTLSGDFKAFFLHLEALQTKAWPGIAPSCRYRKAYSRSGYITRICQAKGMADLVNLVINMPEFSPSAEATCLPRTFGSWEWGRSGLPNDFHSDATLWQSLVETWTSSTALFTDLGLRCVEDGLRLLLKIALAWSDIEKLTKMPIASLPVLLQNTVLHPERMRLDILRGIGIQTSALKGVFTTNNVPIPPRPKPMPKAFITLAPDLKENLVKTITRLRERKEELTVFQTRARSAHVYQAGYRDQILNNRDIARRRREEVAAAQGSTSTAISSTTIARTKGKPRKKAPPPLLPILPLMESLPQRHVPAESLPFTTGDGRDEYAIASEDEQMGFVGPSRAALRRPAGAASRGPVSSGRGPSRTNRGQKTSTRGRASTTREPRTPAKSKGKGKPTARNDATPKRTPARRKSRGTAAVDTDEESSEDFDLRGYTDDDEEEEDGAEVIPHPTPRQPPRPRGIYAEDSRAAVARRKRTLDDLEGEDAAGGAGDMRPPGTPVRSSPAATNGPSTPMTLSAMSQATGWVTPPSAYETRPTKKARDAVSVVLRRPAPGAGDVGL
ncbi:hypothetical protein PENSPDRAFT_694392 [Peniophora sp. CONT]|nr:hypothetical protein PENSPDRAFT_694392 [Peniophora sp. CONT]